jgi:hypothetical protein
VSKITTSQPSPIEGEGSLVIDFGFFLDRDGPVVQELNGNSREAADGLFVT